MLGVAHKNLSIIEKHKVIAITAISSSVKMWAGLPWMVERKWYWILLEKIDAKQKKNL